MSLDAFISHISLRVNLSPSDVQKIKSCITVVDYQKGELLVEQGTVSKSNFYVLEGCLKTYHTDKNGDEHIVAFAIEDWWAGDLASLISKTPADLTVKCLENTRVIKLDEADLNGLFDDVPLFERFFRRLIQEAYIQSQRRIVRNFSLTAKERYALFRDKYPEFERRIPQYLIASYLGITKEFLSKIRKELLYE